MNANDPLSSPEKNSVKPISPVHPTASSDSHSMLDEIINTARIETEKVHMNPNSTQTPIANTPDTSTIEPSMPPPPPRDPMTAGMMMKLLGSLFLVIIIVFGSFLAYIVFNPDQAGFFVNLFGIEPKDIQNILKTLINGSFGTGVLILSILWIINLFRAIWTPKEQKRKRILNWMTASVIGIFLFSILGLWAYLFRIIKDTTYDNLSGSVLIYDNDLYSRTNTRELSLIGNTKNLIGPISLKYDISINARAISKKELITIQSYKIDFDGAICNNSDAGDIISGSDPTTDQGIICLFEKIRTYKITGTYLGKNHLGESITWTIPLDTVEIRGLVKVEQNVNRNGKPIVTLDASRVKNLGEPTWKYDNGKSTQEAIITEPITTSPLLICLSVMSPDCDRLYYISPETSEKTGGEILFTISPSRPREVSMSLTGITLDENQIIDITYFQKDGTKLCNNLNYICTYNFTEYGPKEIDAVVTLSNKTKTNIKGYINLKEPLILSRHVKVQDNNNQVLNTNDTYDPTLGAYVITDLTTPTQLTLDARDIRLENLEYTLENVLWKISDGTTVMEKVGQKITVNLSSRKRYTIEAIYSFAANIVINSGDIGTAQDTIIIDLLETPLDPIISILQTSDYVPAKVTVDASSSRSKDGTISKFIFDWGEGRIPTEGDAIQTYEYRTPGQKKITLTIIDSNNQQISTTKYVILKDTPKNLSYSASMNQGIINSPIDFIADGATGQIEEYIWNFGDNTPASYGYEITHTYTKPGTYAINLTVRYADGTERSIMNNYTVEAIIE